MKKYFIVLIFLLLPAFCLSGRGLELQYPRFGGISLPGITHPAVYAQYVYNFGLGTIGIFALISLIWSGFQYLTSAGKPEVQKSAKERIKATFFALILLAFAYIILTTLRHEWGQLTEIIPTMAGESPILFVSPLPSFDPLLHVHDTAKKMLYMVEKINEEGEGFRESLENCVCENTKPVCAFGPNCQNFGCVGDPCKNREEITQEQILLRIKLEELLLYYRLLVDATREENLKPELWGRENTPAIKSQLDNLRDLVAELEEPINRLRPLIPQFTDLANECEADDHCEADCEVQSNSINKCVKSSDCRPRDPNNPQLCPMDRVNELWQGGSPNISSELSRIREILLQIIAHPLFLPP